MNNNIFLLLLLLFGSTEVCKAQRIIENWNQVNSSSQDIPMHVQRISDDMIILSGVSSQTVFSKKTLTLTLLNSAGRPRATETISLQDTSISSIGGVFVTNSNQYVVFVSFDVDTPYTSPKHFGFILLDSSMTFKKYTIVNTPIDPLAYIESAQIKSDIKSGEYYGMIKVLNPYTTPDNMGYYAHLVVLDSLFNVKTFVADTLTVFDTLIIKSGDINGGDVIKMNDSIYKIVYSSSFVLNTVFKEFNSRTNHIEESISNVIALDTTPLLHYVLLNGSNISCQLRTDSSYIISGTVKQIISPKSASDTLLEQNFRIGQSVIAEIPFKNTIAIRYHLFEPWKFGPPNTVSYADNYFAGIIRNADFIYNNHMFYTRVLNNYGFTSSIGGSVVKITSLDAGFAERWTVSLNSFEDNQVEAPYNIIATADSGCLVFTRKMVRTYVEPLFGSKATFPEFDIAVYKINRNGIVTSIENFSPLVSSKNKLSVYPNPSAEYILFEGLRNSEKYTVTLMDISGQTLFSAPLSATQKLDVSSLKNGLYFYSISTNGQSAFSGKFSVMH